MKKSTEGLGHADHLEAFWLLPRALVLTASGTNPTTGWTNWFEPLRTPNHYEFKQKSPDGIVGQVVLPFNVLNVFPNGDTKQVIIHELVEGKPAEIVVPVRNATLSEVNILSEVGKFSGIQAGFLERGFAEGGHTKSTPVRRHIGTVDIPFACADWQHPLRAKRFEAYLVVEVAGVQDVEGAIVDCLRQAAIAAAVAYLFTPIGWAAGIGAFKALVAACLTTKLHNIIRVDIDVESHCL